jgi:hypothetical protein
VGQTLPVEIVLHNVENGVSGFIVEVTASNASVLDFVDVQHPQYLPPDFPAPIFEITNSGQQARVEIQTADVNRRLEGALERVVIATIQTRLDQAGTTGFTISVDRLDGDVPIGENLLPGLTVTSAELTVSP